MLLRQAAERSNRGRFLSCLNLFYVPSLNLFLILNWTRRRHFPPPGASLTSSSLPSWLPALLRLSFSPPPSSELPRAPWELPSSPPTLRVVPSLRQAPPASSPWALSFPAPEL